MSQAQRDGASARRTDALTHEVLTSFENVTSDRGRQVLQSLTRHLHAFACEVDLTLEEWETGIDFLTRCGHITDDRRQEFILLSDVLGLSMMAITLNEPTDPKATESTVLGPFFVDGSPEVGFGGNIAESISGQPCWLQGSVTDVHGQPISGARIELWECDEDGLYDVQRPDGQVGGRGHTFTDQAGRYGVWSVRPAPYPIPDDGPVGDLLTYSHRSPMRPAHVHFMVTAPGYERLVTHVFVGGDPYLESDAVFGVKPSLIYDFTKQSSGDGPGGRVLTDDWYQLIFDMCLAKTEE